ncbi:hypothetical protein KV097_06000 [Mumia sp. zg.B17]|uniref:hypothetical protein n=1 Tax=unclassified Mumia TaxID=2621872 RepID=UPI001C6E2796|nr:MULTISPECIES: hypothetical protein [unclassified Mumia]MBW9205494.1 hypothetical protein [Mumia sp. zg.B17]MDD9349551.1 hypothetical protein [Mumia sp.]
MIRTIRTLVVGAAAAGLVLATTASPAAAKTRTFSDPRGDAVAALDVTKIKVTNKKHAVVVRMTVPGFKKSKLGGVLVGLRTKAKGRPDFASMKIRIEGAGWMPLMFSGESDEDFVSCKGDRISFGKRSVTVRIPQRCLERNKRAVRVSVALIGRDDALEMEEMPEPGPDAVVDAYPSLTSTKMSPWVRYR